MNSKKIIIASVIAVILLAVAGFFYYQFYLGKNPAPVANENANVKNTDTTQQNIDTQTAPSANQDTPSAKLEAGGTFKAEGTNGGGMLLICEDRCGDGVCENKAEDCSANTLKCVCPETPQDCSQDCK